MNLITAKDNSVGKSTLAKLLFWGLGCELVFDTAWKGLDCKTIVVFQIGEIVYKVLRYKNQISIKVGDNAYEHFMQITGDYTKKMVKILSFDARLPNRKDGTLEFPPPAYYFLPFYIDQIKSWSKAWDNFENLAQYDRWREKIIKYHIGLLLPEHFDVDEKKKEEKALSIELEKIDTANEVVEHYTPYKTYSTLDVREFDAMLLEIKEDLHSLVTKQEKLFEQRVLLESEVAYLRQQQNISINIIRELDKDYQFTVENVVDDRIECPLCGIVHENSVVNRASIMSDKMQAENQLTSINRELVTAEKKLKSISSKLDEIRILIQEINDKYVLIEGKKKISLNNIIESVAGTSIQRNLEEKKKDKLLLIKNIRSLIRQKQKEIKEILTEEKIESISSEFSFKFAQYIKKLNAESINISEINSPLDYNKVIKEGGAAEGVRCILAYYLTIFSMVENYGHEVVAPLVIDTPNQQEQSTANYDQIIDLIMTEVSSDSQVILCAMENPLLKAFEENAYVITLDNNKLLDKDKYQEVKKAFAIV